MEHLSPEERRDQPSDVSFIHRAILIDVGATARAGIVRHQALDQRRQVGGSHALIAVGVAR
jgi:hypothetical protein